MKFKLILSSVIGALLFIVLIQNTQVVSFRFLFWEFSMSRIILLPIVMISGFAIGFIVGKKPWN